MLTNMKREGEPIPECDFSHDGRAETMEYELWQELCEMEDKAFVIK